MEKDMTEYEFEQCIAEAVRFLGKEVVAVIVSDAGVLVWPVPREKWDDVLKPLVLAMQGLGQ